MKTIVAYLSILFFSFSVQALTLSCSHEELCKLAVVLSHENKLADIKTETLVNISGDPHEYEPSTKEIKSLLRAPLLITGPEELNPWIKKIISQRLKTPGLKTISLQIDKSAAIYYNGNLEALSHFWLYPKIYCSLKDVLAEELKTQGLAMTSKKCNAEGVEKALALSLKQIKKPIILTHDALLPLLLKLDPGHSIIALKGSGHHQEINTESIKKMYEAQKNSSDIWIVEKGINIPQNILNKIRKTDTLIYLNTANTSAADSFSVLSELTTRLKGESSK